VKPAASQGEHVLILVGTHWRSSALLFAALWVAVPACQSRPAVRPDIPKAQSAQYRAWMEQARAKHPYRESVSRMWKVMMCESRGKVHVKGRYHGLFQYKRSTWRGAWNPYRHRPILDPRAQIFATAKAWREGHQDWWGCY
jgi:hypothetical protein